MASANVLTDAGMKAAIYAYFDACNEAVEAKTAAFFTDDAVHYFPPGMYGGPFVGADVIGRRWRDAVENLGSIWTVDEIITDPTTGRAVIEWTHFKTKVGKILRGDEWYIFDKESGLIREIRAYYAAPQPTDLDQLELGGFDYTGRGYPSQPPQVPGRAPA